MTPARDQSVRVHALSTGTMTSSAAGMLEGAEGDLTYPVPVFVIEHGDSLTLVDTGLHPDLANSNDRLGPLTGAFIPHVAERGSVGPVLTAAGFDPAQVERVILTHLHFDHAGGLCDLPNARLYVQQAEWAARNDELYVALGAYNPDDFDLGHDVIECDGDTDVFGDATVVTLSTPGHTPGHQSVRVRTPEGVFLLCGDCCYSRASLVDEHMPAFSADRDEHLRSIRRIARECREHSATPVFGHDPEQWQRIRADGLHVGV